MGNCFSGVCQQNASNNSQTRAQSTNDDYHDDISQVLSSSQSGHYGKAIHLYDNYAIMEEKESYNQDLESSNMNTYRTHQLSNESYNKFIISRERVSLSSKDWELKIPQFEQKLINCDVLIKLLNVSSQTYLLSKAIKEKKSRSLNKLFSSSTQDDSIYHHWRILCEDYESIANGDIVIINHLATQRNLTFESNQTGCANSDQRINSNDYWRINIIDGSQNLMTNCYFQVIHVNTQKYLTITKHNKQVSVAQLDNRESLWTAQFA